VIHFQQYADLEDVSRAAVDLCLKAYAATPGDFNIFLCGGRTPGLAYSLLADVPLDWNRVHIYWGDERYVPPTHPESNEGLAHRQFLDKAPIPSHNLHPMYREGGPEVAALSYEEELEGISLDFCFQGLGSDGHTASIFPGDESSLLTSRRVIHTVSPANYPDRITLTPEAFRAAKVAVFLVSGEDKLIPLQQFLAGSRLPSRVFAEAAQESYVLADASATGE
jgi:6-phosphogluconolactonase